MRFERIHAALDRFCRCEACEYDRYKRRLHIHCVVITITGIILAYGAIAFSAPTAIMAGSFINAIQEYLDYRGRF